MSDLFAEVDDAMRQERMLALWKEHSSTFIAVIAAIIIGTGASSAYKAWDTNARQSGTSELTRTIDDAAFPENVQLETLEMRDGLKAVAALSAAGEYLNAGENEKALLMFEAAQNESGAPEELKQLALLSAIRLKMQAGNSDVNIEDMLFPLLRDQKSPWHYHAHLEAAIYAADVKQDFETARAYLTVIQSAKNLPESLYKKARALDKIYAQKMQMKIG
jgi:hypothetical protein